jgi:hypothetical protein
MRNLGAEGRQAGKAGRQGRQAGKAGRQAGEEMKVAHKMPTVGATASSMT